MFKIGDEIMIKGDYYTWTKEGSIGKIIKKAPQNGVWFVQFSKITGETWTRDDGYIFDIEERFMKLLKKTIKPYGIVKFCKKYYAQIREEK